MSGSHVWYGRGHKGCRVPELIPMFGISLDRAVPLV